LQTLRGHRGSIWASVFTDDDRLLITGDDSGTIYLWDVASGRLEEKLEQAHQGAVKHLACKGSSLLSCSEDGTARLWNLDEKVLRFTFPHSSHTVRSGIFNQQQVITGCEDGYIYRWSLVDGQLIERFHTHQGSIVALAVLEVMLISGGTDGTLRFWEQQQPVKTIQAHHQPIDFLALTADGTRVASASRDLTIKVWDVATGQHIVDFSASNEIWQRTVWDNAPADHPFFISAIAFSRDGQYLAGAASDLTIRLWRVTDGELLLAIEGHTDHPLTVAISTDQQRAASGSYAHEGLVRIWDISRPESGETSLPDVPVAASTAAPQGRYIITGSDDFTVKLWDVNTGELKQVLEGHQNWVRAVAVTPDERFVASGSDDRTIIIRDLWNNNQPIRRFEGHDGFIRHVLFSPDNRHLFSASDDGTIRRWSIHDENAPIIFEGHTDRVRALALVNDHLISASYDMTIRVWDVETRRCLRTLEGHEGRIRSLAAIPHTSYVISGSEDTTLIVWDITSGEVVRRLEGHNHWIRAVTLDLTGQYAVSISDNNTIMLWDLRQFVPVATCFVDVQLISCVWLPGSHRIAATDNRGRLHLLNINNLVRIKP
jgi:WD40 repeat protein